MGMLRAVGSTKQRVDCAGRWSQVFSGEGQVLEIPILSLSLALSLSPSGCYSGPLNWFPDRCCLTDSFDPAASPSFLHTTCKHT